MTNNQYAHAKEVCLLTIMSLFNIKDISQFLWEVWDDWGDQELIKRGSHRMAELRDWLMKHPDIYGIDTYYQDMYGYNVSKNWNSILKKLV